MNTMALKRTLAGHEVGAVGLGCMSFGGIFGDTNEADSFACLDAAWDMGIDHLDVAEIYGMGVCETIIGAWLARTKADVKIATKAGIYPHPTRDFRNDEDSLRGSLEGSLRRLGRDHVELFYIHRRDPRVPVAELMGTLSRFVDEGKIGGVGLSEVAPTTLRAAHAEMPVAAVQSEYSLWTRQPELGLIQACAELGTTFVAFSPVARGMITDRFPPLAQLAKEPFRGSIPRFQEPNYSANAAIISKFRDFCRARGWTTAGVACAWTLDQGAHVLPIPGTRTAANLADCAQAATIRFTDEDRAEIIRLLPAGFAHGDRYTVDQWIGVERYC
ncbi:MAG: aryl-alcohol dehydrogenase-like predicted oxidoreductase [Sulfitobacter sp.]